MTGSTGLTLRAEPELARVVGKLRRLQAHERAYAASRIARELDGAAKLVRDLRADALRELHGMGLTWPEVAELVDTSPEQVRLWAARGDLRPEAPAGR